MRSVALPLFTVDATIASARSKLVDEISQLADSQVRSLLDDVLDADRMGNAVGPSSCDCGTLDVRCLTALSAGETVAPGGCWQGQSFCRKSFL